MFFDMFYTNPVGFVLVFLTLLLVKHFIIDFPLQYPWQWQNKGTYGHPGGIFHSFLHAVGTFIVCILTFGANFETAARVGFLLGLLDAVIHYHIDWAKMNINKKMGWGPTTHPEFWTLTGLDQLLHGLTYILLTYLATR